MRRAARARRNVRILPVDSEHSALFQCLQSPVFSPFCVRPADAPAFIAAQLAGAWAAVVSMQWLEGPRIRRND